MRVNGEMLAIAREARGLSQSQFAKDIGVAQGTLSKIESGVADCPDEVTARASSELGFPPTFFAFQAARHGTGTADLHFTYRRRQALGVRDLRKIEARLNIHSIHMGILMRAMDTVKTAPLPRLSPEDVPGGAAQIAQMVRGAWLVPHGPIANVTKLIEATGAVVVSFDFGSPLVDATSISGLDNLPPIIFVSSSLTGDRLRFTLAHELAHVVMHWIPTANMEEEANEFAAEFLMPARDIGPELNGITLQRAAALKRVWKVSMAAILHRARTMGKLSEDSYKRIIMKMNALGIRAREPRELDIEIEAPVRHRQLVELHLTKLGYTTKELCAALGIFEGDFEEMYGSADKRALRIVK